LGYWYHLSHLPSSEQRKEVFYTINEYVDTRPLQEGLFGQCPFKVVLN
jgi:hypothetical protein